MKLLHTSDWHLGAADGERSLAEDQRFFIDEIIRIIREEKIDAVLIAGDIYDRSVSSSEAIGLYDYAMDEIVSKLHIPVISIAGNHDSAERLASCRTLLSSAGLYIAGALTAEPVKVSLQDTDIWLLPWFTEQKVRALYPEKKDDIHSLEDAYRVVCDRIREEFAPGRRRIALAHAFIINAETSVSDRAAEIGSAVSVGAGVFEGFDYVALGHIHKPQDIGTNLRYCGTPMPYSFGKEEEQVKSVTVIDTETMERQIISLPVLHIRKTVEGVYDEIMGALYSDELKNGYIRVHVTDCFVDSLKYQAIAGLFPNYVEISGKLYEDAGTGSRLTAEEFEELQEDPMKIFEHFLEDQGLDATDEHLKKLFAAAMAETEAEA